MPGKMPAALHLFIFDSMMLHLHTKTLRDKSNLGPQHLADCETFRHLMLVNSAAKEIEMRRGGTVRIQVLQVQGQRNVHSQGPREVQQVETQPTYRGTSPAIPSSD